MNLSKIIEMQKKLDQSYTNAGYTNTSNINKKRVLAILVEICEFANEYAPFKYWKKSINIDKNKLVEEFIDGIHFFTTIMYRLNENAEDIETIIVSSNQTEQLIETIKATVELFDKYTYEKLEKAFGLYLGNAQLLNISEDEINKFYIKKNKVNYERIKNGY